MVVIFLVYSTRYWNDKLLRYLFWGNLSAGIFILSLFMLTEILVPSDLPSSSDHHSSIMK